MNIFSLTFVSLSVFAKANPALHHPIIIVLMHGSVVINLCVLCTLVGPSGLEPPTSCLSGTRSNLLSYEPMWLVSDLLSLGWWRWWDSNPWPPACRAGALPAELHPHNWVLLLLFSGSGNGFIRSLSCVGIELFSRAASSQVFSPLQSLTSVFGMGTGGPSAFVTPTILSNS